MIKLNELGQEIFEKRYAFPGEKNWAERAKVISTTASMAEKDEDRSTVEEKFYKAIGSGDLVPGGRIVYGAGRKFNGAGHNMLNCYVLNPQDTVKSIGKTIQDMYRISCAGGGIGFNFSNIRPKGDDIGQAKNNAPGSISVMKMLNEIGEHVKAGGGRRTALIAILNVTHPDLFEFLQVKLDKKQLNNFNISVAITDRFIEACHNNEDWYFTFGNKKYYPYFIDRKTGEDYHTITVIGTSAEDALNRAKEGYKLTFTDTFSNPKQYSVKAKDIWDTLWKNAVESGDPGIFNIDFTNRWTNVSYFEYMPATNPCVTKDNWILTTVGPRKVEELIGKPFGALVDNKVFKSEGFFKTGVKQVGTLKTIEGYEIECTDNHEIYTPEGKIQVKDLIKGQKINLGYNTDTFNDSHKFLDYQIGYLVGLWTGDGHTSYNDKRSYIEVWEDDFNYINTIQEYYNLAVGTGQTFKILDSVGCVSTIKKARLGGVDFYKLLEKYSASKDKISDNIYKQSLTFHKGFISGFFDADGSVQGNHKKGCSIRLSQSNELILKDVQRLLISMGIKSSIFKRRNEQDKEFGKHVYHCKEQYELIISNDCIHKFEYQINFINYNKKSKLHNITCSYKRAPNKTKFTATFVQWVPKEGEVDVYDCTVEGVHKYNCNGITISNCGEQALPEYGNCCLANVNLSNMVDEDGEFNWKRFARAVRAGVQFLDDILEINNFPIEECREVGLRSRRIGLGVMGYHYMLIKLGIKYGSDKCLEFTDRLFLAMRDEAYLKSVYLARDKGPFPAFDAKKFLDQEFAKSLPARIRMLIKEHGIRNAIILNTPPTGTTSMVMGVSSGIEPIFAAMYIRRRRDANVWKESVVVDPLFEEYYKKGKDLSVFVGAYDVTPEEHMKVQATIQKYFDSCISKTINLPATTKAEDFSEIALNYAEYLKGMTIYRAGSKGQEPLEAIPLTQENIDKYMKKEVEVALTDGALCSINGGGCG